ncbi:MAG: DMT family transporter [Nocardioidaceae bacterium]
MATGIEAPTRHRSLGITLVLLAAVMFIVNAGVSRVAMQDGIEPAVLATVRITGTFLVLLVAAAVFSRPALRLPRGRLAVLIVIQGLVGVAALQWTYFVAIQRLPLGLALLLEYQAPVLVAIWAWLVQKHATTPRVWLGLVMAVAGLAAAADVFTGLSFDTVGLIAGLAAAVSFASYFLVGEACLQHADPMRVILWSFGVAAVVLNLVAPPENIGTMAGSQASLLGNLSHLHLPGWVVLGWVIVFGTLLPFTFELIAMRHVRAATVTMLAMLEPIGVAAIGWAWYDETMTATAIAGCVVVVAGLLIAESARHHDEPEPVLLT